MGKKKIQQERTLDLLEKLKSSSNQFSMLRPLEKEWLRYELTNIYYGFGGDRNIQSMMLKDVTNSLKKLISSPEKLTTEINFIQELVTFCSSINNLRAEDVYGFYTDRDFPFSLLEHELRIARKYLKKYPLILEPEAVKEGSRFLGAVNFTPCYN